MRDPLRLSLAAAHGLAMQALLANGVSAAQAAAIADNVTAAERDGCVSHGLFRLPGYIRSVQQIKIMVWLVLQADVEQGAARACPFQRLC